MPDVSSEPLARIDASGPGVGAELTGRSLTRLRVGSMTLGVFVAGGAALALGLLRLGTPSVWVDEAFTARAVHWPFPDYLFEQYHWLYLTLMKPWVAVVGTSEWALRLPSVAAAVAGCALIVVLADKLFNRWVALLGGLLLATNPFLVQWSQQARSYALLVGAVLLATLLLLRALDRESRSAWLGYGLALSAVILIHPVSALVVGPPHAVLLFQNRVRLARHALLALIVAVALCVPWTFAVAAWAGSFWLTAPSADAATDTVLSISGATGLGVPLAILGLWVLRRGGRSDLAAWLGAWAFGPFLLAAAVSIVKPVYLDRYLIGAAPAFALLVAVAIVRVGPRLRAAVGLAVAVATVIGLASWYAYADRGNWRGENWEAAVDTVLDRRAASDAIVVVPWWANPAATYYGARVSDVSTADSIWVLMWSERGHGLPESVRRPLGFGGHRLVETRQFGWRVSAQLWQRDGS